MPVTISDRIPLDSLPIQQRTGSDGQRQLLSTDILGWLQERVPNDAYCLLAVTMVDLYPSENWNFVFGQADLKKRVGVYSFARYHTTVSGHQAGPAAGPLLLKRSCKVLAHETGHMFGMQHCIYFDCLMNGSNHLAEADGKPLHLCPVCLRKLHSAGQIDILDRYRKLKSFADNAGWQQESQWLKWRLKALSAESN